MAYAPLYQWHRQLTINAGWPKRDCKVSTLGKTNGEHLYWYLRLFASVHLGKREKPSVVKYNLGKNSLKSKELQIAVAQYLGQQDPLSDDVRGCVSKMWEFFQATIAHLPPPPPPPP